MNKIVKIVSRSDYKNAVKQLEQMAAKGEKKLADKELKWLADTAKLVAEYEQRNKMVPVNTGSVRPDETDINKIAAALGYEPGLSDIIRFKMLQKKLHQKSLAALLDMTEAKVSQILNSKREPDVEFLRGIHAKLGIDGNVLLETA